VDDEDKRYLERQRQALAIAEKILVLARELEAMDEFAYEHNLVFGAEEAIGSYKAGIRMVNDGTIPS